MNNIVDDCTDKVRLHTRRRERNGGGPYANLAPLLLCGGLDLGQTGCAQERGEVESFRDLHLFVANFVILCLVEAKGQQFKIGDDVVQLWTNGAGDDVVHAQFLPLKPAFRDGWSVASAHFGESLAIEATERSRDVEVAKGRRG